MKRGDIYLVNLSPVVGSEQGGVRPVLIIQNDIGNKFSPTVIVAAISTKVHKKMPTHVSLRKETYNLKEDSIVCLEQIRTIDKSRLSENKFCSLNYADMQAVEDALLVSVGITPPKKAEKVNRFNTPVFNRGLQYA